MTYAEVDVIVDGALEQTECFGDYLLLGQFIDTVREDAGSDGYPTEVYIRYHEHDMSEDECSCAQHETDHHPAYEWNTSN